MLPGKTYTIEDYLAAAWRRKWVLVVPTILISVATWAYVQSLPDEYRSEARILIVPQQVPESYVKPTVTGSLASRLQAMSQQILSRARLEQIIRDLNLYPEERKTAIFEDVVEKMRKDIHIDVGRTRRRESPGYFTVGFESTSPRTAMQVTDRLVALFIQENQLDRSVQAEQTSKFLDSQLDEAKAKLKDAETQIQAFRVANGGALSSLESNLQVMQTTQNQLQGLSDRINTDRDRQSSIEREMSELTAAATAAPDTANANGETKSTRAADQLAAARAQVAALELRLKPDHPDVIRARRALSDLETKAAAEALNTPLATLASPTASLSPAQQQRLAKLREEHETVERRIAATMVAQQRLEKTLGESRERAELAPSRQLQYTELTRDYDTLQEGYKRLLTKKQEAEAAADLERRQIGQQFRIIDGARQPDSPTRPNRTRMNLMGLAGGFAIGVVLFGLLEYRDASFRSRDDVIEVLALPVLAVIPRMTTAGERRRLHRRKMYGLAATVALVLIAAAASVWKLRLLDNLVR